MAEFAVMFNNAVALSIEMLLAICCDSTWCFYSAVCAMLKTALDLPFMSDVMDSIFMSPV